MEFEYIEERELGSCYPDEKTGVIGIHYSNDPSSQQHEETHAFQFLSGELTVGIKKKFDVFGQYIYTTCDYGLKDEIEAMKTEYSVVGDTTDRLYSYGVFYFADIDSENCYNKTLIEYADSFNE